MFVVDNLLFTMQSAGFSLQATFGQPSPVGSSSSVTYSNHTGFWHFSFVYGDINGDGVIDLSDVIRVLHIMTGLTRRPCLCGS